MPPARARKLWIFNANAAGFVRILSVPAPLVFRIEQHSRRELPPWRMSVSPALLIYNHRLLQARPFALCSHP